MADIEIERPHTLGRDEMRRRLQALEQKMAERYGVRLTWKGDAADLKGSGVSGSVNVGETTVSVTIKLGMLIRPLASKIREGMEKQIDRALA